MDTPSALVLFSGGQDSATCVAWALTRYARVETIGFAYGQRHAIELDQRPLLLDAIRALGPWLGRLEEDRVIDLGMLASITSSALFGSTSSARAGFPATFVPGRNLLFLTIAAVVAEARGISSLVIGSCETDFGGYPDCRGDTLAALQVAINLGMETRLRIESPLLRLDKAETWRAASRIGGAAFERVIVELTHSCYRGERDVRHAWGYGCGECEACRLRADGWREAKAG